MNKKELMRLWKHEEEQAFKGWDFSYLDNRWSNDPLPWDYKKIVKAFMGDKTILDMGTGGGEFLVSLQPKSGMTYATESYPPNIELCKRTLPEYGIEIRAVENDENLPFDDGFFDLVINRHESFSAKEVYRILKPGGIFVTQQVGGMNNRGLSKFLLGENPDMINSSFNLENTVKDLEAIGFKVINSQEFFPHLRFYEIGALVYFAKIIQWEFPDFSVEKCFDKLCELQETLKIDGYVESVEHRFFIQAIKDDHR